jgi:kynurenine formamidase
METVDKFLTKMYHNHSDFVFCDRARVRAQSPDARIDRMISGASVRRRRQGGRGRFCRLAAESVGESSSTTDDQPQRKTHGQWRGDIMSALAFSRAVSSRAVSIFVCSLGIAAALVGEAACQGSSRPLVSEAQYEAWQTELSNWGRWGKDDQLGTLNLITPDKRRAALALVKEGVPVSLSTNGFTEKAVDVPCPVEWAMTSHSETGATDRVAFPCIHGAGSTHIDSLAHTFFRNRMWNGYDSSALVTMAKGAEKNSVMPMKTGIVTRAVLYDIARLKGVPYLAPGDRIFPEDMEAWERKTGVRVGPGDALVLRWGRYGRRAKVGPEDGAAGFDNSILPWLKQRDVALVVWETAGYSPQPAGDLFRNAVHNFIQAILGIHVLDRADLEALGEAAASRNRWEFMLTVNPLALPNATGSPVNPIATF